MTETTDRPDRPSLDSAPVPVEASPSTSPPERRRLAATAVVVPLLVVVAAPIALSFRTLTLYSRDQLGMSGGWEYLLPVSLDMAAVLCITLAFRAVASGESPGIARYLVWIFAGGSALLAWREGLVVGGDAPYVLPVLPIIAAVMLDVVLRHALRGRLRDLGAIEAPLPRFRATRWLVAPVETGRAWAASIRHGMTSPQEALGFVRDVSALRRLTPTDRVRHALDTIGRDRVALRGWLAARGYALAPADLDSVLASLPAEDSPRAVLTSRADEITREELADTSRRDVYRIALRATGGDPHRAMEWATDRGIVVSPREARRIIQEDEARRVQEGAPDEATGVRPEVDVAPSTSAERPAPAPEEAPPSRQRPRRRRADHGDRADRPAEDAPADRDDQALPQLTLAR